MYSRIKAEKAASPADVLIVPSYSVLSEAIKADIAQPLPKNWIPNDIPDWLYDKKDRKWLALSLRSRILFASKNQPPTQNITSYLDIASPAFQGKVCTRSGTHPYNITLFAEIYTQYGREKTLAFLKGLKNNLARTPQGNDRAQLRALSNGTCTIALANSYYYYILQNGDATQRAVANAIYPISPTEKPIETHMNISGIMLAKHAKHTLAAGKLIQFMLGKTAQQMYTEQNREWPVRTQNGAEVEGLAVFTKSTPPDFETILKAKEVVLEMVKTIGYNE